MPSTVKIQVVIGIGAENNEVVANRTRHKCARPAVRATEGRGGAGEEVIFFDENMVTPINERFEKEKKRMKEAIQPPNAKAIGPYSLAVLTGDLIFVSGQIPINAAGEIVGADAATQARQVLSNLAGVLRAAGAGPNDVVKTTVFLTDLNDFAAVNAAYAEAFAAPYPARATVQVSALPKGAKVEIEAIARKAVPGAR
jgi:2-iminobutanoate/2-iminopropanoate deaminase